MRKMKFEIPASVQAELDARDAEQKKEVLKVLENGVFQLEYPWSNDKRGMPNLLLRSALFGVARKGRREMLDDVEIASWGSTSIKFTGKKLQQSDQDVWMACVEACKRTGSTYTIITQRELCKLAGKTDNKRWLLETLNRLVANAVTIRNERFTYMGSLIQNAFRDNTTGHITLSLDPQIASLFGDVTHIEVERRKSLAGDLSKWLQGYAMTHKSTWRKPHWVGLDKLQNLCGSTATIRKFRQQMKASMTELKAQKIVAGWTLENDVLKFWK